MSKVDELRDEILLRICIDHRGPITDRFVDALIEAVRQEGAEERADLREQVIGAERRADTYRRLSSDLARVVIQQCEAGLVAGEGKS